MKCNCHIYRHGSICLACSTPEVAARLKRIGQAAFPSYTGRTVRQETVPEVTLSGRYWDGGSRSEWRAVNLSTFQATAPVAPGFQNPPQFGGPSQDPTIQIPEGFAIVENAIFCGKKVGLTIYVSPPVALPEVDPVEALVDPKRDAAKMIAKMEAPIPSLPSPEVAP